MTGNWGTALQTTIFRIMLEEGVQREAQPVLGDTGCAFGRKQVWSDILLPEPFRAEICPAGDVGDVHGQVIVAVGQSQTVDGITVTLHGAIWDGNTMLLSLTLTGAEIPGCLWEQVGAKGSWLLQSEAEMRKSLSLQAPHLTEEEINQMVDIILEDPVRFSHLEITSTRDEETGSCRLLVKDEARRSLYESNELVLHLENLEFQDMTIVGPFEFTFTAQQKDATVRYTGRTLLAQREGYDIYVTGAEVSPFRATITYELSVPLPEGQYDSEAIHYAVAVDRIRVNSEEFSPTSSRGSTSEQDEDGYIRGSGYTGSFDRIVDPAQVEALRMGGVWLELDTLTKAPDA